MSIAVPLKHREEEFTEIFQVLSQALLSRKGRSLYISGMPGAGKTQTVERVLCALHKSSGVEPFHLVELNGATSRRQNMLAFIQKTLKTTRSNLEKTLSENPTILVLDEFDLFGQRRELYTLFDFTCKYPLCVVSISNTLEIPRHLLATRILSRLGLIRINFKPYSHEELQDILGERGTLCELVSRKVSNISGDVRRAQRVWKAVKKTSMKGKIDQGIVELQKQLDQNPEHSLVLEDRQKELLALLKKNISSLQELHEELRFSLEKRTRTFWPFEKTLQTVLKLQAIGLVEIEKNPNFLYWRVLSSSSIIL